MCGTSSTSFLLLLLLLRRQSEKEMNGGEDREGHGHLAEALNLHLTERQTSALL